MPAFPTMEKENVKLRTSLKSIRLDDIKELLAGQESMPNAAIIVWNTIEEARQAQNEGRIKNAYVKIGLVKKSLVFRIKHDKGHWGEHDLMIVRVYQAPEVNDEIGATKSGILGDKGALSTSAGKPTVSLAWWNKARGRNLENESLQEALEAYEERYRAMVEDPMLSRFIEVDDALEVVRKVAADIHKRMSVNDDKKIMIGFLEAVGKQRDVIEDTSEAYTVALEKAHEEVHVDIKEIQANPRRNLDTLAESLEKDASYDVIARNFARIVPQFERSVDTTFDEVLTSVERSCKAHKVSENDIDLDDLRRRYLASMRAVRDMARELDELSQMVNEREVIPGQLDLQGAPNTVDRVKLARAADGYRDVLETCQRVSRALSELVLGARQLGELGNDDRVEAIDHILSQMVQARRLAKDEMAKMRNSGSLYTAMKIEAGGTEEHTARYFEPMTNLILTEAMRQRRALAEMSRLIRASLDGLEQGVKGEVQQLVDRSFKDAG